jgi:hypothetical protein
MRSAVQEQDVVKIAGGQLSNSSMRSQDSDAMFCSRDAILDPDTHRNEAKSFMKYCANVELVHMLPFRLLI